MAVSADSRKKTLRLETTGVHPILKDLQHERREQARRLDLQAIAINATTIPIPTEPLDDRRRLHRPSSRSSHKSIRYTLFPASPDSINTETDVNALKARPKTPLVNSSDHQSPRVQIPENVPLSPPKVTDVVVSQYRPYADYTFNTNTKIHEMPVFEPPTSPTSIPFFNRHRSHTSPAKSMKPLKTTKSPTILSPFKFKSKNILYSAERSNSMGGMSMVSDNSMLSLKEALTDTDQLSTNTGSSRHSRTKSRGVAGLSSMLKNTNPLIEAAKTGDSYQITQLFTSIMSIRDVNVKDRNGWTPLHHAAYNGHADVVDILLSHPNLFLEERTKQTERTALFLAAQYGHAHICTALMSAGANVNFTSKMDGATPLHVASQQSRVPVVELLIKAGVNVNAADIEGMPPLMWAFQGNALACARILIGNGANLEARIKRGANLEGSSLEGVTVLLKAVTAKNHRFAQLFLEMGADANALAPHGMRPIHRAASKGDVSMIIMLLEFGADVHEVSVEGWTPLHFAARNGHKTACELLLRQGANERARTRRGESARAIAKASGFANIF